MTALQPSSDTFLAYDRKSGGDVEEQGRVQTHDLSTVPATDVRLQPSTLRRARSLVRRNPTAVAGGLVGLVIICMALAAPFIAPYDPLKADFRRMVKPPDGHNYFGTDQIGRDTLSRVIYGARSSLIVAFGAVLLGTTVGSLWGLASGYLGGKFDTVSQRLMEILQSFPDLILAMAISMAIGTGMQAVVVAIAATRIPFGGRVIRAVAMTVKELAYVEAGRSIGASQLRMMRLHILPQCLAPYLVLATTHLGVAIIIEAALGFLGVGIPPPTPTWGNMLADSLTSLVPHWWLVLFPGLAITLTVLAFNLLGDGIRDTLDPRLRRGSGSTG
jgi:peptide/nickel transport system permease protein